MATLTLNQSFDGIWPPDAMAGGIITVRQGFRMIYTSDAGFTVTIRGNGLTYDDDGLPSGGTVTGFTIVKDGQTHANLVGASVDFARAGMLLFGFDRSDGDFDDPDPFGFVQNALRGNDLITGSSQDDDIRGGAGNDTINCGAGYDYVDAESGDDVLDGGDDRDTLSFDEANWRWDAYRGVNLDAATGIAIDSWGNTDHFMNFERYRDTIYSDTLKGSDGDEVFEISRGSDVIDGRDGFDSIDYRRVDRWGAHHGVNVNLATGIAIDSWKNTDTISNIEGVRGTIFNDRLTGSARDESFLGGRGVDTINGAGGTDWLEFWNVGDNDVGHGVTINLSLAVNIVDDGFGNVETALGIENIYGSRFDDRITGNAGRNELEGGDDGNDTINGGGGEDFLSGQDGNDILIGGVGNDHMNGGHGNDTLTGNTGEDDFNFGGPLNEQGVDTITDMQVGIDEIWVDSEWGGLSSEFLIANQFRGGAGVTTANSATQRLVYNSTTGDLYFDADGVGGMAAVRFAVLSNRAAITFDDFHVFL